MNNTKSIVTVIMVMIVTLIGFTACHNKKCKDGSTCEKASCCKDSACCDKFSDKCKAEEGKSCSKKEDACCKKDGEKSNKIIDSVSVKAKEAGS